MKSASKRKTGIDVRIVYSIGTSTLIGEHLQITGFSPPSSLTPYEPLAREPPPGYPITSPSRGVPSTFMELLSQMIHSWLETLHMPSHMQGPSAFGEPYPVAQHPTAPETFVHSPYPQPISGDSPLVAVTQRFTLAEEEYLHTFQPMTLTASDTPPAPSHPFLATPQQQPMYVPAWPAAQLGPPPLMPLTQPAPSAPFPVLPAPVTPLMPPFQAPPVT